LFANEPAINYHHLNNFAKTLDGKIKQIYMCMHHSLGVSLKQLTRFFDVQKNLSFSLENQKIKTYIHPNNQFSSKKEDYSPYPIYSILPPKYVDSWIGSETMSREILNSESTLVSTQEPFSPTTKIEKTQSDYMSKNLFENKKTKLLSSYMSNKSLINPSSNFSSLKSADALFYSASLLKLSSRTFSIFFTSIILLLLLFLLTAIP
jgi:hypothetical protein